MASTASYASLITRATNTDGDDPTLIYDITDKVKQGGADGATEVSNAIRDRLVSAESHIKVRVLNILDTLIIECGSDLHKALVQTGLLVTLADIRDAQLEAALPAHITQWKSEMGSSYDTVFEQAFPPRTTSGTQGDLRNQNNADSRTLTRRGIGGVSQFKVKPVSPLYPFLTIAYFRALRVLDAARDLHICHMQGIHIARQALHLVILLNDSVDQEKGPTEEQEDERIDLEEWFELLDLEDAIPNWGSARVESKEDFVSLVTEIKQQYEQFFKERFYFSNPRNPDKDRIYKKLLDHDHKTIKIKQWQQGFLNDDDDDGRSTGFIESVRTSPALSAKNVPKEEETTVPLSQVNLKLDPSSTEAAAEQPVASTSAAPAVTSDAGDAIEAARRFRKQEDEGNTPDQSFTCPVPGCGRRFDKQHLLKHHIREHDDRPYRCPMRNCDRRFATPTEQRVHEALHRIQAMGIIPNMPAFAPPIASTSTPAPPAPEPVTTEEAAAEEVKSDGKPEDVEGFKSDDDLDRPFAAPEDREEKDLAEAVERSIQDQQQRQAEEPAEGDASTSNQ